NELPFINLPYFPYSKYPDEKMSFGLYLVGLVHPVFAYASWAKQYALIAPSIQEISVYPQMKRHTLFRDNRYSHFVLITLYELAVQYHSDEKSVRPLFPSGLIELKG